VLLRLIITYLNLQHRTSKWATTSAAGVTRQIDDITTYLDDPVASIEVVWEAGGYMKYWYQASLRRPNLSKMGSDFCSAPGMWFINLFIIYFMCTDVFRYPQQLPSMLKELFQTAAYKSTIYNTTCPRKPSKPKWLLAPGRQHLFTLVSQT
jgi:hypothetical protein